MCDKTMAVIINVIKNGEIGLEKPEMTGDFSNGENRCIENLHLTIKLFLLLGGRLRFIRRVEGNKDRRNPFTPTKDT